MSNEKMSKEKTPAIDPGMQFTVIPEEPILDQNLTDAEFRVLGILLSYKGEDGTARPLIAELAKRKGCSPRVVRKHVAALEKKGYIVRRGREGESNIFEFLNGQQPPAAAQEATA